MWSSYMIGPTFIYIYIYAHKKERVVKLGNNLIILGSNLVYLRDRLILRM